MAYRPFEELPQGEQEDFVTLCVGCGWLPQDFIVRFEEIMPSEGEIGPIERRVIVEAKSNGWRGDYPAGNGTAWVVAFEADLRMGRFGDAPGN